MVDQTRRSLLGGMLAAGALPAASSFAGPAATESPRLPAKPGVVAVTSMNAHRHPHLMTGPDGSMVTFVDLQSHEVTQVPTQVRNSHDIVPFLDNQGGVIGLVVTGKGCHEVVQLLDADLNSKNHMRYAGLNFRGHGMSYDGDVLLTAESIDSPMDGGILIRVTPDGEEVGRFPTGGIRPHHLIDLGDFFAVSHYGHKPVSHGREMSSGGYYNLWEPVEPSITLLDKNSLAVVHKFEVPKVGTLSHIAARPGGGVEGIYDQIKYFNAQEDLFAYAAEKQSVLLPFEVNAMMYIESLPWVHVPYHQGGNPQLLDVPAGRRDAQSIIHSPDKSATIATFSYTNGLYVGTANGSQIYDSRQFGISEPRGCDFVFGSSRIAAVTGNVDSVALVDVDKGKLIKLIPATFNPHSHCHWLPL